MVKINPATLGRHLKGKDTVMFVLSREKYSDKIIKIVGVIAEKSPKLCYVTVNKTAKALVQTFRANKIDVNNFWFIDCISRASFRENLAKKEEQKSSLILFVDSPKDLADLNINVLGAINNGVKHIFIDALSTFVIYNNKYDVIKFAHSLMSKIREAGGTGYFVVLRNDVSDLMLDDLSMLVDESIDL